MYFVMKSQLYMFVICLFGLLFSSCQRELIVKYDQVVNNNSHLINTSASAKDSYVQISPINKNYLSLTNGETFIPIGLNIAFIRFEVEEVKIINFYEHYFKQMAANDCNFARIWLSAPAFEVESTRPGMYDLSIANRVDKVVALAEKYNIRIKFCFEHFRQITGYPAPFIGATAFEKPIYALANGGSFNNMVEYITTKVGRELYIKRVEFWANRYAEKKIIFGWELWNEMEAIQVADGVLIELWMKDIFPKVKKLLPNHLIMQSMGSFDSPPQKYFYSNWTKIDANSIAQVHRYLDLGASFAVCRGPIDDMAIDAVTFLRNLNLNKPIIMAEVGAVEPKHSGPSKLYEKDRDGIIMHDFLFAPFFSGAAAPGQFWHWEYYVDKNNLWYHYKRFSNSIKGFDPIVQGAIPQFSFLGNQLKMYKLNGKNKELIWIKDGSNDWKTELELNIPPKIVSQEKLSIPSNVTKVSAYDPWKDTWTDLTVINNTVVLPDFTRSLVVSVEKKI